MERDNEEYIVDKNDEGQILTEEEKILEKIKLQIENKNGNNPGIITQSTDYIVEYFKLFVELPEANQEYLYDSIDGAEDLLDEDRYERLFNGLVQLYKEIGIKLDLSQEDVYMSDLHGLYLVFVLDIKTTLLNSYKGKVLVDDKKTKGNFDDNLENIENYIQADEFSPMDDLIQNAFKIDTGSDELEIVIDMIEGFTLFIDHILFTKYLSSYTNPDLYTKGEEEKELE